MEAVLMEEQLVAHVKVAKKAVIMVDRKRMANGSYCKIGLVAHWLVEVEHKHCIDSVFLLRMGANHAKEMLLALENVILTHAHRIRMNYCKQERAEVVAM